MTSKEALQHIINLVSDDTYYRDRLEEEFEILQKDLEVLKILKKHFSFKLEENSWADILSIVDIIDLKQVYGINCTATTGLHPRESEIIKGWLNE